MKQFYDAVKAMIPAQASPTLFTAKLSKPPVASDYPYVVLWGTAPTEFSGESPEEPSLSDEPDAVQLDLRLTYAGLSASQLDVAMTSVSAALNRRSPTVVGWICGTIRLRSLLPIQPDRDVFIDGRNPLYAVQEFTLTANRL